MRLLGAALAALALTAAPAQAQAQAPMTLGSGPGGLLALDVSGGTVSAVIGRDSLTRPFGFVTSDGKRAGPPEPFGAAEARDPVIVGTKVAWSRVVNAGMEYSLATVANGRLGAGTLSGKGTGPAQLAIIDGRPLLAYPDRLGNAAISEGAALTADAPDVRHLPLDLAGDAAPLVLDLAQTQRASVVRVLGADAPRAPVLSLARREDVEGTLVVDDGTLYVGIMRAARAFLYSAPLRPDARWSIRRLPGPGGGSGAPAVARVDGTTYVAYGQGSRRRDIYLAKVGARTRVTHLTDDPLDDSRPLIATTEQGDVYLGWTRERRGAETGTALLIKTG